MQDKGRKRDSIRNKFFEEVSKTFEKKKKRLEGSRLDLPYSILRTVTFIKGKEWFYKVDKDAESYQHFRKKVFHGKSKGNQSIRKNMLQKLNIRVISIKLKPSMAAVLKAC